jgi:hypothetical protein
MSPPTVIRSPDRPARSQSLYGLSYPGRINCTFTNRTYACVQFTILPPGIHSTEDQAGPRIYTRFGKKNSSSEADSVSACQAIPAPLIKAQNSLVLTTAHHWTQFLARLIQSVHTLCLSSSMYYIFNLNYIIYSVSPEEIRASFLRSTQSSQNNP